MIVNLDTVFHVEGAKLDLDFVPEGLEAPPDAGFSFGTPVRVCGSIFRRAGVVYLSAVATFQLSVTCDRCLAPLREDYRVPIEHVLVKTRSDEENDELVVVEGDTLDLDPLIAEDVFLFLPYQFLCREDCRGICPQCGKDLNEGPCGCAAPTDSRFDVLRQLLDSEQTDGA